MICSCLEIDEILRLEALRKKSKAMLDELFEHPSEKRELRGVSGARSERSLEA